MAWPFSSCQPIPRLPATNNALAFVAICKLALYWSQLGFLARLGEAQEKVIGSLPKFGRAFFSGQPLGSGPFRSIASHGGKPSIASIVLVCGCGCCLCCPSCHQFDDNSEEQKITTETVPNRNTNTKCYRCCIFNACAR